DYARKTDRYTIEFSKPIGNCIHDAQHRFRSRRIWSCFTRSLAQWLSDSIEQHAFNAGSPNIDRKRRNISLVLDYIVTVTESIRPMEGQVRVRQIRDSC